jgi:hypothetical protein
MKLCGLGNNASSSRYHYRWWMRSVGHNLALFHPTYHGSGVVNLWRYFLTIDVVNAIVVYKYHHDDDVPVSPRGGAAHFLGNVKTLLTEKCWFVGFLSTSVNITHQCGLFFGFPSHTLLILHNYYGALFTILFLFNILLCHSYFSLYGNCHKYCLSQCRHFSHY